MKKSVISDNIKKELEERKEKFGEPDVKYSANLSLAERIKQRREAIKNASDKHLNNQNITKEQDKIVNEVQDEVRKDLGDIVKQMLAEDEKKKQEENLNQETNVISADEEKNEAEVKDPVLVDEPKVIEKPKIDEKQFMSMNIKLLKTVIKKTEEGIKRLQEKLSNDENENEKEGTQKHIAQYEAILEVASSTLALKEKKEMEKNEGEER